MTASQAKEVYRKSAAQLRAAVNMVLLQSGEQVVVTLTNEYREVLTGIEMRKCGDYVEMRGITDSLVVNCHGETATIRLN